MKSLVVTSNVDIEASAEKVWKVLTQPEFTKQYMFGCEPVTTWEPGSRFDWKGVFNGTEMVAVTGVIKEIKPYSRLAYTTLDPNASYAQTEANSTTVVYELLQKHRGVSLRISQGDFANVADGEKRFGEVQEGGGWDAIAKQIKNLTENI